MSDAKRAADRIVEPKIDQLMRGAMLEATRGIVEMTPVDTGRARNNWNASVRKPDLTEQGTVGDPVRRAQPVIAKVRFSDGEDGYLANGLEYIGVLEDGRVGNRGSLQAPNGMVRVTLNRLRPWLTAQARKIGRGF